MKAMKAMKAIMYLLASLTILTCYDMGYAATVPNNKQQVVYTAGSVAPKDGEFDDTIPCLWKDNTFQSLLPAGMKFGYTSGICTDGSTIYISGGYAKKKYGIYSMPCIWKGNRASSLTLPGGAKGAITKSIFLYQHVPYVLGYYLDKNDSCINCYWAGNQRIDLTSSGMNNAEPNCIIVNNGIVYIAGSYRKKGSGDLPCYWKGTKLYPLNINGSTFGTATSICFINGKLIVSGYYKSDEKMIPCYWDETNKVTNLPVNSEAGYANSVCATKGNIYDVGKYVVGDLMSANLAPCLWVNKVFSSLPIPAGYNGSAETVYIFGLKTYISGNIYDKERNKPCYWSNGKIYVLPIPEWARSGEASGLLVK